MQIAVSVMSSVGNNSSDTSFYFHQSNVKYLKCYYEQRLSHLQNSMMGSFMKFTEFSNTRFRCNIDAFFRFLFFFVFNSSVTTS